MSKDASKYIQMRSNLSFLLIDENEAQAQAMKLHLKKIGYTNVHIITNYFNALSLIIQEPNKFEFIVCKYLIEDQFSTDLLDELKNNLSINRVPFLVFYHNWENSDVALITEKGADAILTVPYISKDLAENISLTWSKYIDPNNIEYHFELGRRLFLKNDLNNAFQLFEKLEERGKILSRILNAKANILKSQKKLQDALNLCDEIISKNPSFVHAYQLKGEIYLELNNQAEALIAFINAINISPKNPFRYQHVGSILSHMKRWNDLNNIMELAEKNLPPHLFIDEFRAKAYIELDQKEEALKYYKKLTESDPSSIIYLNNLAVCYKKLDDLPRAIQAYTKASQVDPKNTKILYNLALSFIAKKKNDSALKTLNEILEIEPDHEKAKLKIMQINNPEEYAEYIKNSKNNSNVLESNNQEPKPLVVTSSDDETKITNLIAKLSENKIDHKVLIKADKVIVSQSTLEKIKAAPTHKLIYQYNKSLNEIRNNFYKMMKTWFEPIINVSEEICVDIHGQISQLTKDTDIDSSQAIKLTSLNSTTNSREELKSLISEIKKNKELKDQLFPILMQLQFQDYLKQALEAMINIHPIPENIDNMNDFLAKKEKVLFSAEDQNMYKKNVLKQEPTPAEDDNMMLFF